jgi:hypothetical protein
MAMVHGNRANADHSELLLGVERGQIERPEDLDARLEDLFEERR